MAAASRSSLSSLSSSQSGLFVRRLNSQLKNERSLHQGSLLNHKPSFNDNLFQRNLELNKQNNLLSNASIGKISELGKYDADKASFYQKGMLKALDSSPNEKTSLYQSALKKTANGEQSGVNLLRASSNRSFAIPECIEINHERKNEMPEIPKFNLALNRTNKPSSKQEQSKFYRLGSQRDNLAGKNCAWSISNTEVNELSNTMSTQLTMFKGKKMLVANPKLANLAMKSPMLR